MRSPRFGFATLRGSIALASVRFKPDGSKRRLTSDSACKFSERRQAVLSFFCQKKKRPGFPRRLIKKGD